MNVDKPQLITPQLGEGCEIDTGVLIGYPTARAIGDMSLRIGRHARLRSGTVIYAGTNIGSGFQTGHNVVIREESTIGDDVQVWSNSVVDYGCTLGHRIKIHCGVFVAQVSVIEDDVFLAPGVMIANDPFPICSKCIKGATIKRGARIGLNATILPHVTIGEYAFVGAGSVVVDDVPAGMVVVGNPARVIKRVEELNCPLERADCEGKAFMEYRPTPRV